MFIIVVPRELDLVGRGWESQDESSWSAVPGWISSEALDSALLDDEIPVGSCIATITAANSFHSGM
jgi:hypothetical protein